MIRVIVADDHPVVRIGTTAVLEGEPGIAVIGEAKSSTEVIALLESRRCDVLVTDFSMPGGLFGDGLQMLGRIRRKHESVAIIVLTMVSHGSTLRAMAALGCHAICDKRAPLTDCVRAIRAIGLGRFFRSETIAASFASADDAPPPTGAALLTPKEAEVVRMVAEGYSVEQIAARLHRSSKTISSQKRHAMLRLGIASDGELARYAYDAGLAWR